MMILAGRKTKIINIILVKMTKTEQLINGRWLEDHRLEDGVIRRYAKKFKTYHITNHLRSEIRRVDNEMSARGFVESMRLMVLENYLNDKLDLNIKDIKDFMNWVHFAPKKVRRCTP